MLYRSGALKLLGRLDAGEGETEEWGNVEARREFSRAAARVVRFNKRDDWSESAFRKIMRLQKLKTEVLV
jgi:hypothetical protein